MATFLNSVVGYYAPEGVVSTPLAAAPAPAADGYAASTLDFRPDYFNRTYTATVVLPSPYQAVSGTVGAIIQQIHPFVRFSREVPLPNPFSGVLPDFPGDFYFQVDGAVDTSPVSVFQFRYDFSITQADLDKPQCVVTTGTNSWSATLTPIAGKTFDGTPSWALERIDPFPHLISQPAATPLSGTLAVHGTYRLTVAFSYVGDPTQITSTYDFTY